MRTRFLHRLPAFIGTLALALPLALPAAAQTTPPKSDHDITRGELDRFDDFLDRHPAIAKDVRQNPSLLTDQSYLDSHKDLAGFLNSHPGVREEVKENPQQFVNREKRFERSGNDVDRAELARADAFFDKHPNLYNELKKDPRLVDDPNFMAKHPEFKEFLTQHPELRSDIKSHPKTFLSKERKFERNEADRKEDRREDRKQDRKEDRREARERREFGWR